MHLRHARSAVLALRNVEGQAMGHLCSMPALRLCMGARRLGTLAWPLRSSQAASGSGANRSLTPAQAGRTKTLRLLLRRLAEPRHLHSRSATGAICAKTV